MNKAVLRFDGGCLGNPGKMYGSYHIRFNDTVALEESKFQLGHGTNNVAEFLALIRGLNALEKMCLQEHANPRDTVVSVFTDSMIVKNRLTGKNKVHSKPEWKSRSEVMFNLANECLALLRQYCSFTVEWEGRSKNVAVFGH
jgi:ribonuclease HI